MAQTYTLEEAADKLNLSASEFKRRLQTEWTKVRPFRDGATLRFRSNEIDELARTYGLGSSDEMSQLTDSSPLDIPENIGLAKKDSGAPLALDDSVTAFVLTPDAPSSKKLKSGSDSDVRLEKAEKKKKPSADDEESILTEEFSLDAGDSGKLSGKSGKLSSAKLKSGDSGKNKAKAKQPEPAEDSSEFELTLDADSDEFELSLTQDSSEEVSLGDMPAPAAGKSGQSGINLNRPTDSGVSLEKKKAAAADDSDEVDFELSLDAPGTGLSSKKKKKSGSSKNVQADSDSEFELTLEEPSDLALDVSGESKKEDIFEATDFEIPALDDDSASEVVSLDDSDTDVESSDFDLALDEADAVADDESESQVVALADDVPKKKKKRQVVDEDGEPIDLDDEDAVGALRGVRDEDDDEDEIRPAASTEWGPLPAILMFPTLIVLFVGTIMAYELLHSMWGYQQSKNPSSPLVNWLAETTGAKGQ